MSQGTLTAKIRTGRGSKYDISLEEVRQAMENPQPCADRPWAPSMPAPPKVYPISKTKQAKLDATARRKRKIKAAKERERLRTDPQARLYSRVRGGIRRSLRGVQKGGRWELLFGYSTAELKAHLEAQFLPGMTWENSDRWHIDHIRPLSSFKIEGWECPNLKAAWALENLQPLWATDNLRKGASWEG